MILHPSAYNWLQLQAENDPLLKSALDKLEKKTGKIIQAISPNWTLLIQAKLCSEITEQEYEALKRAVKMSYISYVLPVCCYNINH